MNRLPLFLASASLAFAFSAHAADDVVADGQVAVRDAATGQLRAPTASEMAALQAAGGKHAVTTAAVRGKGSLGTQTRTHASGATGARLSDQFMSASVVVKQPDGRLVEYCFQSPEAAAAAVSSSTPAANAAASGLPTE